MMSQLSCRAIARRRRVATHPGPDGLPVYEFFCYIGQVDFQEAFRLDLT
jgi:hypothetical protein